ncbi:amidohydrolase [Indioceanicola profundi]|uniref:amidohydrolase n=1 Tax=Indioceanicola profundi TaxID=2220096 RepID=UPI000E6AAA32|nr:amidohydrolase [Indioceanicola profundi]
MKRQKLRAGPIAAALMGLAVLAPAAAQPQAQAALLPGLDPTQNSDPFPSTYRPLPSVTTAITGATVLTGTGEDEIQGATVLMQDGRIVAVGTDVAVPPDATVIDAKGKWVTPGIIDAHSHLGVYPSPSLQPHSDGNEMTSPNTPGVWSEHSVWPQDAGFTRALAGGVTSLMVLPGSANLFGGRTVVLKNLPARTMQAMKFPGAPYGLKMACGENPKRVYGGKGQPPATRMGNVKGYREAWIGGQEYRAKWDRYRADLAKYDRDLEEWRGKPEADRGPEPSRPEPPTRDLDNETLAGVLAGEISVQNHCYRADEMAVMADIADEFGFKITMFHHASEAYKIADLLAKRDICVATWAEWWGFKMESYDGIEENAALLHSKGVCTVIHSDDETIIQRLNQEAAIAMAAGRRMGIEIDRGDAITWITRNPARAIGVLDRTGTLEPGKMADVVIWNTDPFSVYAVAERVYIDGGIAYDRFDPKYRPQTDFELGQAGKEARR